MYLSILSQDSHLYYKCFGQSPTSNNIITQIGRENNISDEILLLRTVEDACPYKCCVKHPYEKERKPCFFVLELCFDKFAIKSYRLFPSVYSV